MLKKVFTICAISILNFSTVSGYEIVIDSTMGDYLRNDSTQTVVDLKRNLVWQDDESATRVNTNWQEAINYCQNLNLGEYSDWRLPSHKELLSIVDKSKSDPAMKSDFKNVTADSYWSSTPYASSAASRRACCWALIISCGRNRWSSTASRFLTCRG